MSKSRPSHPPTKGDWDKFGPIIADLYRKHSLKVVMTIMRDHYEFRATERMYKARLPKLNVQKYRKNTRADPVSPSRAAELSMQVPNQVGLFPRLAHGAQQTGLQFMLPAISAQINRSMSPPQELSNAEFVVFHVRQYAGLRFQMQSTASTGHILDTEGLARPSIDEILWQKMYKGLALLEQATKEEAFEILESACELVKQVLQSQPHLLLRAIFMVFGTSRWDRFKDVWVTLLKYLAGMASVVLKPSHPVSQVLRTLLKGDALQSSAELSLRGLITDLEPRLGTMHSEVLRTRRNLSIILRRQNEHEESEEVMRHAIDACEQELGPTHVETLRCLRRQASLFIHHGKLAEAEQLLGQALIRAGNPDHNQNPNDTDTFVYANRDLALIAMQQNDMETCRFRLQQLAHICQAKLQGTENQNSNALGVLAQPLSLVDAERHIKDIVMAYDLHCDELASRFMSSRARVVEDSVTAGPSDVSSRRPPAGSQPADG